MKIVLMGFALTSTLLISCGNASVKAETNTADTTAAAPQETKTNDVHYKVTDLVDLDLSANGIPMIVKAPKGSKALKSEMMGSTAVVSGKTFGLNITKLDGDLEGVHKRFKEMAASKESMFGKFLAEDKTGFLIQTTDNRIAFQYFIETGGSVYQISDVIPMDIWGDEVQFMEFTPDDIKVMYEAAKATMVKK